MALYLLSGITSVISSASSFAPRFPPPLSQHFERDDDCDSFVPEQEEDLVNVEGCINQGDEITEADRLGEDEVHIVQVEDASSVFCAEHAVVNTLMFSEAARFQGTILECCLIFIPSTLC